MCKILVQNFIIKDILKNINDVHWISVRTLESRDSNDTLQAKQLSHDSRKRLKTEFIAYIDILL